jgi:hypothetical protein
MYAAFLKVVQNPESTDDEIKDAFNDAVKSSPEKADQVLADLDIYRPSLADELKTNYNRSLVKPVAI